MIYNECYAQWIDEGERLLGSNLRNKLLSLGHRIIAAGSVMVFQGCHPHLMFQLLQDLDLNIIGPMNGAYLVGYEKGSLITALGTSYLEMEHAVPTLRFRDCRMPTLFEYKLYFTKKTV